MKWNFDNPPLVMIEWFDAESRAGWMIENEVSLWVKDIESRPIKTVGYLILSDKYRIVIAAQRGELAGEAPKTVWGGLIWVPKPWIKNMSYLSKRKNIRSCNSKKEEEE